MFSTLALYGVGGVVVLVALWGLVKIIQKGAASKVAADMNESVVKDVEAVKRAQSDPDKRKRVRDKYSRK